MRKNRRHTDQERLDRLREAFWSAADTAPAQVADTYEARATYERESLSLQIMLVVQRYMKQHNISQQALAKELDISEGRISQILSGEQNLTLKTLASVAAGLKAHFEIGLMPAIGGTWERPYADPTPDAADNPETPAPAADDAAVADQAPQRDLVTR